MPADEPKESRKTRYTKAALRESLIELMQTRPILTISVKELCARAEISRSTFYAHYKDQYALLKQMEDETLTSVERMLKTHAGPQGAAGTRAVLEAILTYIADNSHSIQVLLSENGDIDFQKRFFRRFTDAQKMMRYFSEHTDNAEKTEYHLVFVVSGSIALLQHWLKNNMKIPIPEMAALLADLLP